MQETKLTLPKKRGHRAFFIRHLYMLFNQYEIADLKYKGVNSILEKPLSLRTLKTYKAEWEQNVIPADFEMSDYINLKQLEELYERGRQIIDEKLATKTRKKHTHDKRRNSKEQEDWELRKAKVNYKKQFGKNMTNKQIGLVRKNFRAGVDLMQGVLPPEPEPKEKKPKIRKYVPAKFADSNIPVDENIIDQVSMYVETVMKMPPMLIPPKQNYSETEQEVIVNIICDTYAKGMYNLIKLSEGQGINIFVFNDWLSKNEKLKHKYDTAREHHMINFIRIYNEYFKESKLRQMLSGVDTYITREYEFVPVLNKRTGKMEMQRIEKREVRHMRPRRPDSEMERLFLTAIKEMHGIERQQETQIISDDFENMDLKTLLQRQEQLLNKMKEDGYLDEIEEDLQ